MKKDGEMMDTIRMAYLLVAHGNVDQLNVFISQLIKNGDCDIYVHIDKKNNELIKLIKKTDNVFVCSEYSVSWGSFEIIRAAVMLMRKAYYSGRTYSHFYFGSGQDLLVKRGLYEYLKKNPNSQFINVYGKIIDSDKRSARYRIKWPKCLLIRNDFHVYRLIRVIMSALCARGIILNRNERVIDDSISFYTGSTWFLGTKELMDYIINYLETNPDYYDFWQDSLASDLMFFHTIVMNSRFKDYVQGDILFKKWGDNIITKNHPKTITMEDTSIIEKSPYYFARKFDFRIDSEVIQYYLSLTGNGLTQDI